MTITAQQFRADSDKRDALMQLLQSPILMEALACITEVPTDVIIGITPTYASRLLGEIQATARFVPKLLELTTPLLPPKTQPSENFGTNYRVEQFDEANIP